MNAVRTTRERGFTMVEALVALVIVAIGLLGLAKMESLAIASTDVSGTRTTAAIQAASLASMMHANNAYWGGGYALASTTVQVTAGAVAISNAALAAGTPCTTAGATACNFTAMAAYDLNNWATQLQSLLPGYLTTISCSVTGFPVTCTIQIAWTEEKVAVTDQQATTIGNLAVPTYTLYVQP